MNHPPDFTVIILTYNEEANIGLCLDSVTNLGVPVFVVDSYSSDRTVEILRERGINFLQHPFKNYSSQRNWAQANLPVPTEWVLHLDAGEVITPELGEWLKHSFTPHTKLVDGYMFARRAIFMGRWIKYGGFHPIYHLRLYRRELGHCEAKVYDQHFVVAGVTQKVPWGHDITDKVMNSLTDFTTSHARWAVFEAVESIVARRGTGEVEENYFGNPIEKTRWLKNNIFERLPLFLRAVFYWVYRYILKLGFLDGREGLIFHFLQGFWFRFLVDSITHEIELGLASKPLHEVVQEKYNVDINIFLDKDE